MASTGLDSLQQGSKMATQELIAARQFAVRLRESLTPSSDSAVWVLANEVVGSISRALLALDLDYSLKPAVVGADVATPPRFGVGRRDSPARQGACRRRRSHPYLSTTATSGKLDDGYTWRKYGQKDIYNTKFPRCYFRCTHKTDQGCPAKKQVQQSEQDPSMYVVTYVCEHTCRDPTKSLSGNNGSPYLIRFGSSAQGPPLSNTLSSRSLKQESDVEVVSTSSATGQFLWQDLTRIEVSVPGPMEPVVGAASEHESTSSGLQSPTNSFGLDFMADSFLFDEFFGFY